MSIYSGFAMRKHETYYNKLLFKTIQMLSERVVKLTKVINKANKSNGANNNGIALK